MQLVSNCPQGKIYRILYGSTKRINALQAISLSENVLTFQFTSSVNFFIKNAEYGHVKHGGDLDTQQVLSYTKSKFESTPTLLLFTKKWFRLRPLQVVPISLQIKSDITKLFIMPKLEK